MSRARLVVSVLLPFAAGYYLSYLFRSINALIAGDLTAELGLERRRPRPAHVGLLPGVRRRRAPLRRAARPLRAAPRRQRACSSSPPPARSCSPLADGVWTSLLVGRALIGLGVAVGLMAGLKAIVLWFPPERVALANGWLHHAGRARRPVRDRSGRDWSSRPSAGAACSPLLAVASAAVALLILLVVPEKKRRPRPPLPHRGSASSRSTGTRASCASRPWPRSASARPSRCRASGPRRGSPTLRGSIALPSSSISP